MPISNYPAPRFPIGNSQWRYTATGGETTLSGYDVSGTPMAYVVNSEQVFQNGVMLVRNVDYTASTGTSVVLNNALAAGDFVEILTYSNFNVATLPSGSITGLIQNSQLQNNSLVLGSVSAPLGSTVSSLTGVTIDGSVNSIHTNRGATNPATATAGDFFWNTTSGSLQVYNGSSWISFAPPAAPTIGTATDVGTGRAFNNAAAIVTFTPNNTGGTATQYFVTSTPGGLTSYGYSSPITITGLTTSTQYTFTVTAQGSFGNSSPSSSTGSLTVTSVPQAPTIGTVTQSVNSVSIPFTANGTGGKTITGYTVTSSSGVTATGTTSPISLSEASNGNYTYTITATNANGTSASSSPSNSLAFAFLPTVSGGSLTSDATYYYRTFTGNGTLSVSNAALTTDILIIAGGGGGDGDAQASGGGGAGGVLYGASNSLSVNSYGITIGAGGTANEISYGSAAQGNSSSFGTVIAAGGGQGGWGTNGSNFGLYAGGNGGSGGGGGSTNANGTTSGGTVSQTAFTGYISYGNGGGTGACSSAGANRASGGGGGAGGSGTSAGGSGNGGNGGSGTNAFSSWISAISAVMTGVSGWSTATSSGYIAGGGGGGGKSSGGTANGGGGAGGGGTNSSGTAGTANTGGGAGSGFNDAADLTQNSGTKNGGSGIVIVRYTRASVGG